MVHVTSGSTIVRARRACECCAWARMAGSDGIPDRHMRTSDRGWQRGRLAALKNTRPNHTFLSGSSRTLWWGKNGFMLVQHQLKHTPPKNGLVDVEGQRPTRRGSSRPNQPPDLCRDLLHAARQRPRALCQRLHRLACGGERAGCMAVSVPRDVRRSQRELGAGAHAGHAVR